jgi:DNA invertase Pin-like site-specific DNA recombinase
MNAEKRAACLYLRSSKDRHEVSLDAQRRELEALASSRGLVIVREYADAVQSGQDENRPGFQALLRDLKARGRAWTTILMLDTSRLGRRRYLAQAFKHECRKLQVAIVFAKVPDVDPISNVLLESVMEAMDEVHSLMSREKGLAGMAENVRQGFRAGGRAPAGYRLVRVPTGGVRDGVPVTKSRLELGPEAPKVQAFLRARAQGMQQRSAARAAGLELAGATLVGIEWNALTYAGATVWNVNAERIEGGYAGGTKRRPRAEWVIQRGTHPALITEEEAEAILRRLEAGAPEHRRRRSAFLLGGLVRTPAGETWAGDRVGYRVRGRQVAQRALERAVLERLQEDLQADDFVAEMLRVMREAEDGTADRQRLAELQRDLAAATKRLQRLETLVQAAGESEDSVDAVRPLLASMGAAERDRAAMARELALLEHHMETVVRFDRVTEDDVRAACSAIAQDLPQLEPEGLKDVLQQLIEKVELDPTSLACHVHYRGTLAAANRFNVASPRRADAKPGIVRPVEIDHRARHAA